MKDLANYSIKSGIPLLIDYETARIHISRWIRESGAKLIGEREATSKNAIAWGVGGCLLTLLQVGAQCEFRYFSFRHNQGEDFSIAMETIEVHASLLPWGIKEGSFLWQEKAYLLKRRWIGADDNFLENHIKVNWSFSKFSEEKRRLQGDIPDREKEDFEKWLCQAYEEFLSAQQEARDELERRSKGEEFLFEEAVKEWFGMIGQQHTESQIIFEPWNEIPDIGYDRVAVKMLWQLKTDPEIGQAVGFDSETIGNRFSQTLRKKYPKQVPTRREIKKILETKGMTIK